MTLNQRIFFSFKDTRFENGIFRIADFGSGKIHTYRSGSANTRASNGTLTYEPPEATLEGATSRPYDMWSLGCVFLEVLIWALFDYQSVKTFADKRIDRRHPSSQTDIVQDDAFWQVTENGVVLRQGVNDWIRRLAEQTVQQKGQPFKEALELIKRMLDPKRQTRINALHVWDTIDRIYTQKKVDLESAGQPGCGSLEANSLPLTRLSLNTPDRPIPEPLPISFPNPLSSSLHRCSSLSSNDSNHSTL